MERLSNPYAGGPPTPAVNPEDADQKYFLHHHAAGFVDMASTALNQAIEFLTFATQTLDEADGLYDGDNGLDSKSARAHVANVIDALENVNLDDLAHQVRGS